MFAFFVLFLVLCSGSLVGIVFHDSTFAESLPITTSSLALCLFIFGLLGHLEYGVYFILAFVALIYLFCFARCIKKSCFSSVFAKFFSPGFLLFVVLLFFLYYLNYGRNVYHWDELSHWALVVKSMSFYDALGTTPTSGVGFKSYPPIMALFQYFFIKIFQYAGTPDFQEWILYFAYQIFPLSFIFPFISSNSWKRSLRSVFFFLTVCIVPLLFFNNCYHALYIDPFLSIVGACAWAVLVSENSSLFKNIYICICASVLVLAKDVGTVIAIFLAIGCITKFLFETRLDPKAASPKKAFLPALMTVLSVLVPKLAWSKHLDIMNVDRNFSNSVDFGIFFGVLAGNDNSYRKEVVANYIKAWSSEYISFGEFHIRISYGALFLLLGILLFITVFVFTKHHYKSKAAGIAFSSIVLTQHFAYAIGLCIMYMFKFSEYEAVRLASFGRYINIIFLFDLMLSVLLIGIFLCKLSAKTSVVLLVAISSLAPLGTIKSLLNGWEKSLSYEYSISYEACSKIILSEMDSNDSIYIVSQEDSGYDYHFFKYKLFPQMPAEQTYSLGPAFYEGDIWSVDISAEQWQKTLVERFDYVFLFEINDYFSEHYGHLFEEPEKIRFHSLYRVNKDAGTLSLVITF